MLRRTNFKKRGLGAFYRNWKSSIIICFIYAVLVGSTVININREYEFDYQNNIKNISINNIDSSKNNSEIVNDFLNGLNNADREEKSFFDNTTRGVLGTIFNNISKSGSYLFGFLNAVNQFLFNDRIWASVVIITGALISLFYWIFVSKVLEVGYARFFLENRKYTRTKANKLILPYKLNKTTHIAYTMFIKNLYTFLWSFTIIGFFIKYYQYMMVPYILAENPNMKTKDLLKLSKDMMVGYKWEIFKLDVSFVGWYILGFVTFNISNLVFTTPYMNATRAEVYMYLRDLAKTKGIKNAKLLSDEKLEGDIVIDEYPVYENLLRETKRKKWLSFNYKRDYTFVDLLLLFFIFSLFGWCFEVLLHLFQYGYFVNKGTLYGPWLPIYGSGAVALLVILKNYRNNPFSYFVLAMVVCGIIEYLTSVYLEVVHGLAWWDYSGYFLNINGRICLEALIVFGVFGTFITYIVAPFIANFLDKIKKDYKVIICIVLSCLIICDFIVSGSNPNTGEGITIKVNDKN